MIYKVEDGYVISSHHVWIPGVYDSERTARFAFRCTPSLISEIVESHKLVTWDHIAEARKKERKKSK